MTDKKQTDKPDPIKGYFHPAQIRAWCAATKKPTSKSIIIQAQFDYWWRFFKHTKEGKDICNLPAYKSQTPSKSGS